MSSERSPSKSASSHAAGDELRVSSVKVVPVVKPPLVVEFDRFTRISAVPAPVFWW